MARPRSTVSIYTLSKKLGLSAATISKALGDYPQISETTRARVRAAAKELDFTPNRVSRRTVNICAVIQRDPGAPINFKPYVASVLEGLAHYTWSNGLESSFFGGDYLEINKMDLVRELYKRQVDGAVLINADVHSSFIQKMIDQRFPYVCLATADRAEGRRIVGVDERAAAVKAADYLFQLGHRHILVLLSNAEGQSGKERLAGFLSAAANRKIEVSKELIIAPKDLTLGGLASGFSLVRGAMRKFPRVTAVYAMDQNMALGASRALTASGYHVPNDVSVICCDDCEYHEYSSPPISAVSIPTERLAYHAARLVHEQILGSDSTGSDSDELWLQPELIVRESTAPARAKTPRAQR